MKTLAPPKGIALVAALILLLGLTILGLTSLQLMQEHERITRNTAFSMQAFHTSDSSLVYGEEWLLTQVNRPDVDANESCLASPCLLWSASSNLDFATTSNAWWLAQGRTPEYSDNVSTQLSSTQNRFVIEEIQMITDDLDPDSLALSQGTVYYRVTSWGIGYDGAESTVQSIYAQRY